MWAYLLSENSWEYKNNIGSFDANTINLTPLNFSC